MTKEQFFERTYPEPNTGCWIWGGRFDSKGYGRLSHRLKHQVAHRYSYEMHYGSFDIKLHVLHKCDNPYCVNPDHLYLGDQRQNNIDRDTRGRQRTKRGTEHKLSKLTDDDVRKIRSLHNPKIYSSRKLSLMFGVSQGTIMKILKGIAWHHVM